MLSSFRRWRDCIPEENLRSSISPRRWFSVSISWRDLPRFLHVENKRFLRNEGSSESRHRRVNLSARWLKPHIHICPDAFHHTTSPWRRAFTRADVNNKSDFLDEANVHKTSWSCSSKLRVRVRSVDISMRDPEEIPCSSPIFVFYPGINVPNTVVRSLTPLS